MTEDCCPRTCGSNAALAHAIDLQGDDANFAVGDAALAFYRGCAGLAASPNQFACRG
jgi:hypothetical protein